jgi:hypothetical protein
MQFQFPYLPLIFSRRISLVCACACACACASRSARFELCHGYPTSWNQAPQICMSASGTDSAPKSSLRGHTRSSGEWHVYTAIYDHKRSELFVDGVCEASGKSVGANGLDGLTLGCDHTGVFYLHGAIAEVRIFRYAMPPQLRVATECALARRYGLPFHFADDDPTPPPSPARSLPGSFFSCVGARSHYPPPPTTA